MIRTSPSFAPAASAPALRAWTDLVERLRAADIPYCHWKSNEHLAASFAGEADLDLLVDRAAAQSTAQVLEESGFKLFKPLPGRGYPGIDDWIGFSSSTGRLLHAHVHYQLTVGEPFLKGYRLPWESLVLETRQWDARYGLQIADPHAELILLLVRAALKIRVRDRVLGMLGGAVVPEGVLREFRWLARQVTSPRLLELGRRLVGAAAAETLVALAGARELSVRRLLELRYRAEPRLSTHRLYHPLDALRRRWSEEVRVRVERIRRRLTRRTWSRPRTPPAGGLSIAFVGGDGSGKSTLTRVVSDWLSRQAVVFSVYGGSGSGPASLARRMLERLRKMAPAPQAERARASGEHAASRGAVRALWRGIWGLALARERRSRAAAAYRARSRGAIVIWDRLPQTQFPRVNDGLHLAHWRNSRSALARWAARYEHTLLRAAEAHAPDLVIKLHVSQNVALERKPDTPSQRLLEKLDVTRRLTYPSGTRVVNLDADRPLEQVLLEVQRAIWELL